MTKALLNKAWQIWIYTANLIKMSYVTLVNISDISPYEHELLNYIQTFIFSYKFAAICRLYNI